MIIVKEALPRRQMSCRKKILGISIPFDFECVTDELMQLLLLHIRVSYASRLAYIC